ncbi:MAG TPA: acyltransferase [Deinococcales bacterium]|nr:acyltransferase [Deinococcales bacterium]
MPWLNPLHVPDTAERAYSAYLNRLDAALSDETADRNVLCRDLLAEAVYGTTYEELQARSPLAALNLDPRNVTLEAEAYAATDPERFARAKPILWLWKNLDLTPLGQNLELGVRIRRVLAGHLFARVGRNFKCFPGVEFSVGYNMSVGDDVVVHRNVLLDDIGGITLHDGVSLSDFVNVYSHTHSALNVPDVTLKHTTIGAGARITYHATVLAGVTISDDAMLGALGLATHDIEPQQIATGIPARATRRKLRHVAGLQVDSRRHRRPADRKGNPADYPAPVNPAEDTAPLDAPAPAQTPARPQPCDPC